MLTLLPNFAQPVRRAVLGLGLIIVLLGLSVPRAVAQGSTTGAIGGTIADTAGALLPGTAVVVTSKDTGEVHKAKANSSGEYRVSELQPGSYSISFRADGFQTEEQNEVVVTVGSLSNVSPKLIVGSVQDKVEVNDETPLMHTQSNDISTTIDQVNIDNLPINGRRFSDFALLTPGVVSNSDGFGLLSFRGISFLLNNNTVDGADDNQAYFSEARGRTRDAYTITQVAVQEFQVNTSNYSAQYGRSAGGVINTVTKSGTNQYHGELFFYDRDNSLGGATDPYTLLSVVNPTTGVYNSVPYKPTDWRKEWGFGVGGPILKDKLFWFYAYDQERRNFPGTSRPTDPGDLLAPAAPTLPAGETCSTTTFTLASVTVNAEGDYAACALAALDGVPYQAGAGYYNQGLGVIQSFIGTVPRRQDQVINTPKVDYQINDRQRLSFLYNRLRYSSPSGLYSSATETEGVSGWGSDFIKEDFGVARLTSVLSNAFVNEALVQYGRDFEYNYQNPPQSGNEVPLAQNQFGAPPSTQIGYYLGNGIYEGSNPDLTRFADPDERRLQVLDSLTWSHGKHVSKFGLEYNRVTDYVNNLYNDNGSYSFDYPYLFIAQYENLVAGVGNTAQPKGYPQLYYGFSQGFGNPVSLIATQEYAGYATDDWRVTPRLTLTLGLRYEYEYVPPSPTPNPLLNGTSSVVGAASFLAAGQHIPNTYARPDDRNNIGPRVGFALNVFGDGNTTLRGGYGLYYGRIINSNILQTYEESGGPNAQRNAAVTGTCPGLNWPNLATSLAQLTNAGCVSNSTVAYLDSHLQNPEVHEADLALEQNLGHGTVLSLSYLMSLGRELPSAIDTNINLTNTYNATFTIAPPPSGANAPTSYPISTSTEAATSYSQYPQPAQNGSYTVLPNGGTKLPFVAGQQFTTKVFLQPFATVNGVTSAPAANTRLNPNFYQILDVRSDVNSTYHALAVQLNHRFSQGFSLLSSYTWSHAMDGNPYESTVVPSYTAVDPTNLREDFGNSNTNVPNRFILAGIYEVPAHFHGFKEEAFGGWRFAPIVQVQNGLPYTPYVSGHPTTIPVPLGVDGCTSSAFALGTNTCPAPLAYSSLNGAGSSAARLPWLERNTYKQPSTIVVDARVAKNFYIPVGRFGLDRARFEVLAELFNAMNHQNITGISNDAYTVGGTTLTPYVSPGFGTFTNANSNYTYSPRQLQIAARLHF